jgi:hypothetical protein
MKNILLIFILCLFLSVAVGQNTNLEPRQYYEQTDKAIIKKADDYVPFSIVRPAGQVQSLAVNPAEVIIGMTQYDLQSNALLNNRIFRYADGTIGAVWTMGMEPTSFPGRGTGYNFYDGTEWYPIPTERIESLRTGWPSYAPLGAEGEIVVSHDFAVNELYFNTRQTKGSGDWTETKFTYTNGPATLSWARMITSGTDNLSVHMVANSVAEYLGQPTACVYSRSLDGGATWDIENTILDGMGDDSYFEIAADDYVWAEPRNGMIAFLCGSAWYDLFMMKSDDDGDNWEKTVIWEHPYPFFDWNTTITDTFFCVDNSANIALDADGKAHVVFGINRVYHTEVGTNYFLFPYVDGIGYWNEDMETFSNDIYALAPPDPYNIFPWITAEELVEDENYIGWMQDVDGNGTVDLNTDIFYYRYLGASTMPTISVDDDGSIFVLYSSTTEGFEIDVYNYKHIWGRAKVDGQWGPFVDVTEDISHIFDECIYPQLAGTSDDFIYYLYNTDVTPGFGFDGSDHSPQDNNYWFAATPKSFLYPPWLVEENTSNFGHVAQNSPNPFHQTSLVEVDLNEPANLSLVVRNIIGQVVYQIDLGEVNKGVTNITIDAAELQAGTYFYTVTADGQKITKKMIVN